MKIGNLVRFRFYNGILKDTLYIIVRRFDEDSWVCCNIATGLNTKYFEKDLVIICK